MKRLIISILLIVVLILAGCTADEAIFVTANISADPTEIFNIGLSTDGTYQVPILDATTRTFINIDNEHHQIHEGNSYTVADTVAADTTTVKWQVETANTTEYVHMMVELFCTGEATYLVTEGSDRNKGTLLSVVNRRRIGTPPVSNTIVSRTPTGGTTDGATILFSVRSGITNIASKNIEGGQARALNEWILRPGTKYVISITTYAATYATCLLHWYEHVDLLP